MLEMTLAQVPAFFLSALYAAAALALGFRILAPFPEFEGRAGRGALALAAGLGVLGLVWSLTSLAPHGMGPFAVYGVLLAALASGWRPVRAWVRSWSLKPLWRIDASLRWAVWPVALFLFMIVRLVFHPQGTDALAYYFAQGKLVAYAGHFVPLPFYEVFALMPVPAELHYAALIAMGSEHAARLFSAFNVWACAGLVYGLAALCGAGAAGRWFAVLLLLTSSAITLLVSDGKTDLYGAALGLAALYAFFALNAPEGRRLVLLAVLIGLALNAKISFIAIMVPMFALLYGWHYLRRGEAWPAAARKTMVAGLLTGVVIIAVFVPGAIKNALLFQEPLAPFFFFGAGNADHLMTQRWFSPEATRWILMTYPLAWTFGQYPMQGGVLSPLVWAALPALLLGVTWRGAWRQPAVALAVAGAAGLVAWMLVSPGTIAPRYVFPGLLAFIPLAALGLERIWNAAQDRLPRFALGAGLGAAMMFTVVTELPTLDRAGDALAKGAERTPVGYIWKAMRLAEAALPEDGRLHLAGWERAPLSGKTLNCLINSEDLKTVPAYGEGTDIWTRLWHHGTRVVLVNVAGRKDMVPVLATGLRPGWLDIRETTIDNFYTMYEMTPKPGAPQPAKRCTQTRPGYWEVTEETHG